MIKLNKKIKENIYNGVEEDANQKKELKKSGCGGVIEEWTEEDDDGKIIDNGWYHCGENNLLCDECKEYNKALEDANQNLNEGRKE